jgi:copper chaperone NosL
MNGRLSRRGALACLAFVWTLTSCEKGDERCALCGMKIDSLSAWRADLELVDGTTRHFDTPRCALRAWRGGRFDARTIRVIEYYDRVWKDGNEVAFVIGSDVNGPMGPDVVPVDPLRAQKFADDHSAGRPMPLRLITSETLADVH